MRPRLFLKIITLLVLLVPIPALVAPFVSEFPIFWAYRVYHPFLYRYPQPFSRSAMAEQIRISGKPLHEQSLGVLRFMIDWY